MQNIYKIFHKALFAAVGCIALLAGCQLSSINTHSPPTKSNDVKPSIQPPAPAKKKSDIIRERQAEPEPPSSLKNQHSSNPPVHARKHMVVAANPHAAAAGLEILEAGGNAVDAAIATQMVLNLVEPQSSGIGGGAFLIHFSTSSGAIDAYDGREMAPAATTPDMFLNPDGKPMSYHEAIPGGLSVGVPGVLRMLELAHKKHGNLPWGRLFQRAIQIATDGFKISPRLHRLADGDRHLRKFKKSAGYFLTNAGRAKAVGSKLINLEFAEVLRKIAEGGADAFYNGEIAKDIVRTVRNAPLNPGRISLEDMKSYKAKRREPVCGPYRSWFVCGMPPPTSGGITTLQILGMLKEYDLAKFGAGTRQSIHIISEASKLAFADRNHYLADPDFVNVPIGKLLEPRYLAVRSKRINTAKAMTRARPGKMTPDSAYNYAPDTSVKGLSTSHISIVDKDGNVASMTTTIENAFGSRLMVRGFLLNNELTDFSFVPIRNGKIVANSAWPGKRPRSSMAPIIVFDGKGKPVLALGSPGGSRIIGYVAKTIIAVLDWKLNAQQAVEMPHFVNRNGPIDLEKGTKVANLKKDLEQMGHTVRITAMTSGLHVIRISGAGMEGGADPRREGSIASE